MSYATKYTTEKIMKLINDYHSNLKHLIELNKEYYDEILGGNIAMYGLEAAMPKAVGGNSDPVFREVNRQIKRDKRIDRIQNKVLYIQNRWDRIIERSDEKLGMVFHYRLKGYTYEHISKILQCTPQRVHQIQLEIAEILKD